MIKRISAIELHIRNSDDDIGDTAEGIFAKAEAQTADQTEEIEAGMKRKIDSLRRVNGHKLQPITDTDTGWVRCTECARTVGGMSDKYWPSNSCNRNQCTASECWSRKGYMNLSRQKNERRWQLGSMAIKDKESGHERELTRSEKGKTNRKQRRGKEEEIHKITHK